MTANRTLTRKKMISLMVVWVVTTILVVIGLETMGPGAIFGLFLLPILAGGWHFQYKGAWLSAAFFVPVAFLLTSVYWSGHPFRALMNNLLTATFSGIISSMLGYLQELRTRLAKELKLNQETQAQLVHLSKFSALGEMAGGVAHEINNPLAIITGKASMLRKRLEQGEDLPLSKVAEDLKKIEQTCHRIAKITLSLRTFARDGEKDPFEPASFNQILSDTLELCQTKFRAGEIDVKWNSTATETIELDCRSVQIGQVLLNLLSNAADAIQTLSEKWITIEVSISGDCLQILITDSGTGIPQDVAEKIFDPFFTTKKVGQGTGLGLSISKGIIEDHGGKISARTHSGHTQFVVELPLHQKKRSRSIADAA